MSTYLIVDLMVNDEPFAIIHKRNERINSQCLQGTPDSKHGSMNWVWTPRLAMAFDSPGIDV